MRLIHPFVPAAIVGLIAFQSARADRLVVAAGGDVNREGIPASQAKLLQPFGVAFDKIGNMYIVEYSGHRIRKVDRQGILRTIAGSGKKSYSGDGGPALQACFSDPHSLAVASSGDIYVADTTNNCVRKIDGETGMVTTVAGTGKKGFSGDGGPAAKAEFGGVYCVAFDSKEEKLYLADLDNRRIRVVNLKTGMVDTVAGNGKKGVPEDGAEARTSPLVDPRAVAVDGQGNVYVLERGGNALRVVDAAGKIRTVVGTGNKGFSGDNGDAKQATMNGPKHLCMDLEGNVLIADTENHMIRKYLPREGKIVRVAGNGKKGTSGLGGPPEQAELAQPHGVYVHPSGSIYIADSSNHRILRIEKSSANLQLTKPARHTFTYKTVGPCEIKADVYGGSPGKRRPTVIWIHGGGLITGNREGIDRAFLDKLLKAGYLVVSIDYRLAPETKVPAILEDLEDACGWVREKGPELFGVDPQRIAVSGGSAGGYLTFASGFRVEPRPAALVSFWGYGELASEWYSRPSEFYRKAALVPKEEAYKGVSGPPVSGSFGRNDRGKFYLYCRQQGLWPKEVAGFDPDKEPRAFDPLCPLRNVSAKYPPTMLIHGTKDTDVPYEQSEMMAKELSRKGVEHELITVKDGGHGLFGVKTEVVADTHDRAVAFLNKWLGGGNR